MSLKKDNSNKSLVHLLRTNNFMNICCIIENRILHCYFLEQSEQLKYSFSHFHVWVGSVVQNSEWPICRLWFGPNSLGGVKFRLIVQVDFFNDDWCTGDVIKQKSHFSWSCGLVPLCLTTNVTWRR